jgi:hypothetical protein
MIGNTSAERRQNIGIFAHFTPDYVRISTVLELPEPRLTAAEAVQHNRCGLADEA